MDAKVVKAVTPYLPSIYPELSAEGDASEAREEFQRQFQAQMERHANLTYAEKLKKMNSEMFGGMRHLTKEDQDKLKQMVDGLVENYNRILMNVNGRKKAGDLDGVTTR